MPNIGALLKQEIARLSRKEVRSEVLATKKASAQHRRHIAALKRQVATLERELSVLRRRVNDRAPAAAAPAGRQHVRFVAKGLKSHRDRLGMSAAEYGKLIGVSAQSIYNWEQGHARPRSGQLGRIAALRSIGKREAQGHLKRLAAATKANGQRKR
jgi:ribosome-binding protein aMBF1 (putative translation factor)